MAVVIPVIPKLGFISVHTGNIVNWNRLKRKLTQTPTEELTECISSTMGDWLKDTDKDQLQYSTEVECLNKTFLEKLPEDDRDALKLTAKIFVTNESSMNSKTLQESVGKVMCELGITHIETVLLSMPHNQKNIDSIKPLWESLEEMVQEEKVFSIGISDLDCAQLQDLYEIATVKPCINQVNLDTCCVIPPDLTEYAKEKDIQLLTHSDPLDILPKQTFQQIMEKTFSSKDAEHWEPQWVARYSVIIKQRGIIKTKGYIVKADRDIKKRD